MVLRGLPSLIRHQQPQPLQKTAKNGRASRQKDFMKPMTVKGILMDIPQPEAAALDRSWVGMIETCLDLPFLMHRRSKVNVKPIKSGVRSRNRTSKKTK
jgi:hypothetical protein